MVGAHALHLMIYSLMDILTSGPTVMTDDRPGLAVSSQRSSSHCLCNICVLPSRLRMVDFYLALPSNSMVPPPQILIQIEHLGRLFCSRLVSIAL